MINENHKHEHYMRQEVLILKTQGHQRQEATKQSIVHEKITKGALLQKQLQQS